MMADYRLQLAGIPDLSIDAPDAGTMALEGFGFGREQVQAQQRMGIAQNADKRADEMLDLDRQQVAINQQDAAMRQQAFSDEQRARAEMIARAKEAQAAFAGLYDKIEEGTATAADFAAVASAYPELAEGVQGVADALDVDQKQRYSSMIYRAGTALKLGKPEVAAALFDEHATAAENSGNKDEAALARAMVETIRQDPVAALGTLGMFAQTLDAEVNAELFAAPELAGPEWRAATPEEAQARGAAAGQINDKTGEFKAAVAADAGGPDPKAVQDLRKEWVGLPAVKVFQTQSDSYGRILASATNPSGAGDVALVYSYMKMLDPGSVVREGEFATAEQTGGIDQRIVGIYNRLIDGERLTPEMRADFVTRAEGIYQNAEGEYDALRQQYAGIAERQGFAVNDALPDFRYSGDRSVPGGNLGSQPAPVPTPEQADAWLREFGSTP